MILEDITEDHIEELEENIRVNDLREVKSTCLLPLPDLMKMHVEKSSTSFAVNFNNRLYCLFGVVPMSLISNVGVPWVLTTDEVSKHPRLLIKHSPGILEKMLEDYDKLVNYVDARYIGAVRWIKWLGFNVYPAEMNGVMDVPSHKVEKRRT